jgi:hypothetical protein
MSSANELNAKIAEQTIASISGQIDFVHALSLAVLAGIFAFMLQIVLHNKDRELIKVRLRCSICLFFGALLEGLSVLCSSLAKGALTSSIAPLYRVDFSKIERLSSATFTGSEALTSLTVAQYLLFFAGIVVVLIFLWTNRRLIA